MPSIKDFYLTCETTNEDGSYSEGDTIVGTVNFKLTTNVSINTLTVKAKGDAKTKWTEDIGDYLMTVTSKKRYFKVKDYLIGAQTPRGVSGNLIFINILSSFFGKCTLSTLVLFYRSMPSSFKGENGKIVYMLEAKISKSWWWPSKVKREINFISKTFQQFWEGMVNTALISSSCTANIDRFKNAVQCSDLILTGETLSVVAKICNSSSKHTSPKFKLEQNTVYRSKYHTKNSLIILFKEVGETISPNSERTVSCQLKIPDDAISTIHNCEIISVEYYIKVLNNFLVTSHPLRNKTAFFVNMCPTLTTFLQGEQPPLYTSIYQHQNETLRGHLKSHSWVWVKQGSEGRIIKLPPSC
uniref:Arrestin C-terminal-like domain-containing protein n=1 Tax=Maylandia zebra TaxID=106582 RepID=A0A3P9C8R5_9CICH